MTAPLNGIRIIDLTNVLAGPYCTYQLALLGAEVIKVERPGSGDLARQLGADPARNSQNMGISYLAQNAGKTSLTLNLKDPRGQDILKRLVRDADVVVENYRPGVLDRLGVGYEALRAVNPALIYCAISGFGQDGPWRDNPAYDQIVQGIAGVMSITGTPDTAPLRVGYPLGDTIGGMTAAFAISAALNAEKRGAFLDISMTEAVLSSMGWVVSNYLIGGVTPAAQGNENMTSAPSGTFWTADQPINIAANKDDQWVTLTRILEREDLQDRAAFLTREDRKRNRVHLRQTLEEELQKAPAAHWVEVLNAQGVPCGPVLSIPEVLASAQVSGRGLTTTLAAQGQASELMASPILVDGQRPLPQTPPPELGQQNIDLLTRLGVGPEEIETLKAEGVI
ncbi:CaiB/BaiF CoA transferase family protein [Roseobacter weihaiensis]|uniref:CaiB/BaiF CoA transferase family protein n=1 Tax=Roseobacter weihaiensis TaxID=2763262 RepID=UPI001D0AC029|nr:CoA transferase [Roseobacter sp. H9]